MSTQEVTKADADFLVATYGEMIALTPMTPKAWQACEDGTIQFEAWQVMAGSIMVDHRMADELVQFLSEDGFTIGEE